MPVDTIIVLALILLAYGIFAGALTWADAQTRGVARPPSAESPADERKAA